MNIQTPHHYVKPPPDEFEQAWRHPLPRLTRFIPSGMLPQGFVAYLCLTNNLLLIDKGLYDQLTLADQHRVYQANQSVMVGTF